ncbi:MAG: DEAD/DEAH box helicase [Myxococcaceae bacterium]
MLTAAQTVPPAPASPSLAARLPTPGAPRPTADEILTHFVAWAAEAGLTLYPAQEEAILELLADKHVVLATPTGSGKSLVATALHFKAMSEGKRSFYTCPIKALVNEKFFALCELFGARNVGMVTGDASINGDAPILCCTAEILSNLALREVTQSIDYVVMDEFHYYADKERGAAWEVPLLALTDTTFLLMSATLGDLTSIKESLSVLTGREVAEVKSGERPVPLDFEYMETPLHETVEDLLKAGKYPVYLVNFSQRAAAEQAQNLMSVNFCSKEEKEQIRVALFDARFDTPYGKDLQRFLKHGIGLHHAGLLPKYRLVTEKLAQSGLLKVVSGTDTLGVGVNIPIRTVLFTQLCKFDGEKTAVLSVRDFLQIGGRAGRKGFDDRGSVVAQAPEHVIENLRLEQKKAAGKKIVKKQPPQKGYVHWDRATFDRLLTKTPEPLESRFSVSHGMILNLLQGWQREGYKQLLLLISRSHGNDYTRRKHKNTAATFTRSLLHAGIVEHVKRQGGVGAHLRVHVDLQVDFSLNHTLSLYLINTLEKLDPTLETYPLDVLTLVESILESPMTVLYAQLDKLKGEKVAELKAQGMDYADRMTELEKLEWPKPHRDFIYGTFDEFARQHPWVGQENIRPKSIAREMFEQCASFGEYVREYGLPRSEGVLLRYISDAYKTLVQNVPEAKRTEGVDDVIAFLRTELRQVDSSLLDEWERLASPDAEVTREAQPERQAKRVVTLDPKTSPRAFKARVRSELHRLLRALAIKDYEEALRSIENAADWSQTRFEQELAEYSTTHASIDVTPRARLPSQTFLSEDAPRVYTARQKILAPDGTDDWMLDCVVDLTAQRASDAPLIALRRIGT